MTSRGTWRGLATIVIAAAALTACGGGGGTVTTKRHRSTTTSTSTTIPTTTTQPPVTTTGSAQPAACASTQLSASFGMVSAGAGNRYVRLILTNTGPSCVVSGFVGLQLLGNGPMIPTSVVRSTMTPVTPVVLIGSDRASTLLHWGAIPGGNESQSGPCEPTPQQIQVSVPNQAAPLVVGWSFGPVCEQGQIEVGALQAGVPAQ